MTMTVTAAGAVVCEGCGTEIASRLLSCPGCHRLVHAVELRALNERATAASAAGDASAELAALRSALELLPPESRQFATIRTRVETLSAQQPVVPAPPSSGAWKWLATLGPLGLLLWKFKFLVVLALTKGKLLLLGLTKASTFLSMLTAVGVYWTAWGLPFALGFVVSIYIHEMGHVAALRRYGIAATAPMFIPGVGAFVRMKQSTITPRENARVGLAGPIWGLGACVAAYAVGVMNGSGLWAAIAHTGAWVNLFNLLPVWQLDGSRAFAAMSRGQRWIGVAAFLAAWAITSDGLMVLLLLTAIVRSFVSTPAGQSDRGATVRLVAVTIALAFVFRIAAA